MSLQYEKSAERCMPCLMLLSLIASCFSCILPQALALPYIFNHNMVAFLISNVLCFFINIFCKVHTGWKSLQEQRDCGRSCSVLKPHLWGFCSAGFLCRLSAVRWIRVDFPSVYLPFVKTIRGVAVLLSYFFMLIFIYTISWNYNITFTWVLLLCRFWAVWQYLQIKKRRLHPHLFSVQQENVFSFGSRTKGEKSLFCWLSLLLKKVWVFLTGRLWVE